MTRGFTLLELLITVSVLSILIATAAPSFSSVTQTVKMQRLASELNGFLIQAKSESVKRNQDLWVHFSMDKNEEQSTGEWSLLLKPTEDLSGETLVMLSGQPFRDVSFSHNYTGARISFESVRGRPARGTIYLSPNTASTDRLLVKLSSPQGELRCVVSRVRSMAIMRVKPIVAAPSKQQGTSLIELMVASVIGVFAISIIGSVFITGQRIAKDKGIELLLLQNLTSTMQVMKEDIQRAGYDGSNGYSIKLSGASDTIQVSGGVAVGFVYFREGSSSDKDHRHIVYRKDGTRLQICEKGTLVGEELLSFNEVTGCYSLFDDSLIEVDAFSVDAHLLEQNSIKTTFTDINITASIPTAGVSKSLSVSVKQRNWQ